MLRKTTILFLLLFSVVYAGGSYYQVVGVADDDTLTVRQSAKVPYAVMGWVNMRYLKLDNSGAKSRLPGMTFKGEVF